MNDGFQQRHIVVIMDVPGDSQSDSVQIDVGNIDVSESIGIEDSLAARKPDQAHQYAIRF